MGKPKFVFQSPPPPVDYTVRMLPRTLEIEDRIQLAKLLVELQNRGGDPETAIFLEDSGYSCRGPMYLHFSAPETEEEHRRRVLSEEKAVKAYETWKVKYAKELEAYLKKEQSRSLAEKKRSLKVLQDEQRRLKREAEAVEKSIAALQQKGE